MPESFKALTRRNSKAGYYRALSGVSFQNSVDVTDALTPPAEQHCWMTTRESSPSSSSSLASSDPIRVTFIQRVVTDYCSPHDDHEEVSPHPHSGPANDDEHIYDTVEELGTDVSDSDLSGLDLSIFEPGDVSPGSSTSTGRSSSGGGGCTAQQGFIYRPPRPERPVGRSSTFRERLKKNLLPKLFIGSSNPEPPAVDYDPVAEPEADGTSQLFFPAPR